MKFPAESIKSSGNGILATLEALGEEGEEHTNRGHVQHLSKQKQPPSRGSAIVSGWEGR